MTHPYIKIEKIVNGALTPTMKRARSGSTQLFREDYNDREFTREENADVIIKAPQHHYYAELIEGVWWWVNGCDICNKKPQKYGGYCRCHVHNVCCTCGIQRKDVKDKAVRGHEDGFECYSCHDIRTAEEKAEALAAMPSEEDFDSWDYHGLYEIKCPYCALEWSDSHEHHDADEQEFNCDRCSNKFTATAQHSLTFDCNRIEK